MGMDDGDILSLNQLVSAIQQAEILLEESYRKKDAERFRKAKKFILNLQRAIEALLK